MRGEVQRARTVHGSPSRNWHDISEEEQQQGSVVEREVCAHQEERESTSTRTPGAIKETGVKRNQGSQPAKNDKAVTTVGKTAKSMGNAKSTPPQAKTCDPPSSKLEKKGVIDGVQ